MFYPTRICLITTTLTADFIYLQFSILQLNFSSFTQRLAYLRFHIFGARQMSCCRFARQATILDNSRNVIQHPKTQRHRCINVLQNIVRSNLPPNLSKDCKVYLDLCSVEIAFQDEEHTLQLWHGNWCSTSSAVLLSSWSSYLVWEVCLPWLTFVQEDGEISGNGKALFLCFGFVFGCELLCEISQGFCLFIHLKSGSWEVNGKS